MFFFVSLSFLTVIGLLAGVFSMAGKTDMAIILYSCSIGTILVFAVFAIVRKYQDKRG